MKINNNNNNQQQEEQQRNKNRRRNTGTINENRKFDRTSRRKRHFKSEIKIVENFSTAFRRLQTHISEKNSSILIFLGWFLGALSRYAKSHSSVFPARARGATSCQIYSVAYFIPQIFACTETNRLEYNTNLHHRSRPMPIIILYAVSGEVFQYIEHTVLI